MRNACHGGLGSSSAILAVHAWGKCCPAAFVLWRFGCWSLFSDADWNERAWTWAHIWSYLEVCVFISPLAFEKSSVVLLHLFCDLFLEWIIMRCRWLVSLFLVAWRAKGLKGWLLTLHLTKVLRFLGGWQTFLEGGLCERLRFSVQKL